MLEKRQALEKKKTGGVTPNLEAQIAKTTVKERPFVAMTTPELKTVKLKQTFNYQDDVTPSLANKSSARERIHHGDQGHSSNEYHVIFPIV